MHGGNEMRFRICPLTVLGLHDGVCSSQDAVVGMLSRSQHAIRNPHTRHTKRPRARQDGHSQPSVPNSMSPSLPFRCPLTGCFPSHQFASRRPTQVQLRAVVGRPLHCEKQSVSFLAMTSPANDACSKDCRLRLERAGDEGLVAWIGLAEPGAAAWGRTLTIKTRTSVPRCSPMGNEAYLGETHLRDYLRTRQGTFWRLSYAVKKRFRGTLTGPTKGENNPSVLAASSASSVVQLGVMRNIWPPCLWTRWPRCKPESL